MKEEIQFISQEKYNEYRKNLGPYDLRKMILPDHMKGNIDKERIQRLKESVNRDNEFIKNNPGVPVGSTKLEIGKHYAADMDGEMLIRTINGSLWAFHPDCGEIGEDIVGEDGHSYFKNSIYYKI